MNNTSSFYFNGYHPEWGDEVLRNKDRSVKHPMEINEPFAWVLGTICIVGLLVHLEIITHIFYDKTMRLKSKYLIQLAIAFSDLFIIFAVTVVILHFVYGPNETVCHIFVVFFLSISYNCFFLNYFLSVIECFVAITFPLWHHVYVTPQLVGHCLIGLNLTMILSMEWPFISGLLPVRCALQPIHGLIINGISSVLFLLCFNLCCIDFGITLFHLRRTHLPIAVAIPLIIISPPSPTDVVISTDNLSQPPVIASTSETAQSIVTV